jgi:DNA polymerase
MIPQKQCKWFPVCPMKYYWQQGRLEKKWIDNYCRGNWQKCIRYQKEEAGEYHPDNMLPTGEIDNRLEP